MKDITGQPIEAGDRVAFPGPYGQTLVVGKVTKVWQKIRYGSRYHAARVQMDVADWTGKTERDYVGQQISRFDGTPTNGDLNSDGIIIIKKAIDNSK